MIKFWSKKNKKTPRILLIGAGSFGAVHLRILKELAANGTIEFAGIVVRTEASRRRIEKEHGVMCTTRLSIPLLKSVDAVVIATPQETHYGLVTRCLPYAHVLVEKPLCDTKEQASELEHLAKTYKRVLMVGHVFRFHPVVQTLKKLLAGKDMPRKIEGVFVNPLETDKGRDASYELLHLYDIVDYLWQKEPILVSGRHDGRLTIAHVRYDAQQDAQFTLGWEGTERRRQLRFRYADLLVEADFISNLITITETSGDRREVPCPIVLEPLKQELLAFIEAMDKGKNHVPAAVGERVVSIAAQAQPKKYERPRVAVIGGGIFGTCVAAELAHFASVTLFERNNELLKEGSFINQFRHHHGYHYPRSDETVREIQQASADFEAIFSGAIIRDWPTYYGLAKEGSLVTVDEFAAFCARNGMTYKKISPDAKILAKEHMSLIIEVPEPNYHPDLLRKIAKQRIDEHPNIESLLGTEVVRAAHQPDGSKVIEYKDKSTGKRQMREFDYVINATYANINRVSQWLGYDHRPIRVDFVEALIIHLPVRPVSLTVIDGPFATLMPTGTPHEFTLYHVKESILDRYVPDNGLIRDVGQVKSNREAIMRESTKLFPMLKDAEIIESRYVHRGVQAYREHDDARVAELIEHGFGVWSILSGKILSSVSIAKRLAEIIKKSVGQEVNVEDERDRRKSSFPRKVDRSRKSSFS